MSNADLPLWQCHKRVRAAKITEITPGRAVRSGQTLHFEESPPVSKHDAWISKFEPKVGGYYVVYEDGYESYSPAKAFEEGYTRVTE